MMQNVIFSEKMQKNGKKWRHYDVITKKDTILRKKE